MHTFITHATHTLIQIQDLSAIIESSPCPFIKGNPLHTPSNQCSDFFHYKLVLRVLELNLKGIMQHVLLCVQFSIVSVIFAHATKCTSSLRMMNNILILLFSCFQFLAIVLKFCFVLDTCFHFSQVNIQSEMPGSKGR